MRFESMLWAMLALFLVGDLSWRDRSATEETVVEETTSPFEAADGGTEIPPPP